jgi:hypothetical protein
LALPLLALFVVWGQAPFSVAATYYRWVDESGNTLHSDRPPPSGVNYEVVSTDSGLMRPAQNSQGAVSGKLESKPGNTLKPVETSTAKEEKDPEQCERARSNLDALVGDARIRLRNDRGDVVYLSEEEKEAQRQKALEVMEKHCE